MKFKIPESKIMKSDLQMTNHHVFWCLHPFTDYFLMKYNCHSLLASAFHSLIQQTLMPSLPKALCQIYQAQRIKSSNYSFIIFLFIKAVFDVQSVAKGIAICSLEKSGNQHQPDRAALPNSTLFVI